MDKNDITLNYAFQEYIPEKDLENKGIKDVAPVLTYEEPRWTFKNTSEAMNIIKESDASLYEKIQDYVKEQHLPSENILYLDFGKSLRYDDEYMGDFSKETLEDKLDNLFIVRYSHDNDDGNLIDGGDEIVINDNETVSLLNGMIEEHFKENIKKYEEYKIKKNSLQKNQTWIWKDYDDLSGHLEAPDGTQYFSYDWTTKEYKVNPDKESWDSFLDADPTRDTSLSAFKDYAQNYIKNNIVKDKSLNIVFERNYIDTEKQMEEEEKKMAENETLVDKYNRIEKLFEGKTCRLGNGEPQDFKELYDWVQEEFPEKDSEGVLFEATSRMIEENLDFGEFNYQAFDDVYGFGGGAEWRLDFSDSAAKKLISGEILTLSDAQSLIWEKAENEFAALKENPQYKDEIEITDRINSAFRIADFLYPEFTKEIDKEKNLLADEWPQYSNEEKKTVINNAFEKIKSAFDEKKVRLSDSRTDELVFEGSDKWLLLGDFKALIKGKDAAEHGKESLSYIRPNAEQLHDGIENGWEFDEITTGYAIFQNQDLDVKCGFTPKFISKINDMNVFESDGDAAKQYGIDNNCRILKEKKDIWIGDEDLEYYSYPDIPENRRIMKENGWLLEQPLEFDFSEFTEKDFNRIRDELFKDNPKEDYYGRLHIGSLHVEFVINQNDGWVDTNYYILGEKGEGEAQFAVPYDYFPGNQFIANLFTDNTYEKFKEKVSKAVLEDIAEVRILKTEAMRPLVDWTDEKQCKELYRTKLIESARENEIVIAPYSHDRRDMEAVRDFIASIDGEPVGAIQDDVVMAVIDNIGKVQDSKAGDFLKLRKDGTMEHISALGHVEKEPLEILSIINSFAENHAAVSEDHSQQRKDYEKINSLYKKAYEKHMHINDNGFNPSEYVLNKLKEKGIEVISDKEEFDRILLRENNLQKMSGKLTEEQLRRYFTFDEEDTKKFEEHVKEWQKDNTNPSNLIVVGKTTPIMKILGISEKLIEVEQSTLDKMTRDVPVYPNDKQGHKLSVDDIYAIPSQLADPVMVFKSRTRNDRFVFFTERKDSGNHSILIPLAVDKRKGRIVIHEITSMYGKDNEIDFVKTNIDESNLVYEDRKRSCLWAKEKIEELEKQNIKDAEKNKNSNGERFTQIQFLGQRFTDNGTYTFNILTKERLVNFISANSKKRTPVQKMFLSPSEPLNLKRNENVYGFTYEGKIYLNPDVMNSETAVHEYTHLWDNLTRKDNPELWNKGLKIFKGTSLWNEVINDSHYQDIKDDENLVLSECHARICGRVADSVLNHIAELDGNEKQAEMIDWDKETIDFIFENYRDIFAGSSFNSVAEFTASAMKNLFSPLAEIKKEIPNTETLSFIKEVLEKESGIRVDEKIVGEIYSRYQEHDLNLELEYYPNGTFRAYDYEGGKYTNTFKIGDAVEQVLSWNEKELSELHAGTADDKEIAEIKKINGELERICGQIACNGRLEVLDSADEKSVGKIKKFLEDDGFKVERGEAKTLLAFASDFHDGTSEYAVNDNNQLYFRTSNDNEGWSFISENDHEYGYEIIANAFYHALNLLDDSQKDHVQSFRSFVQKNREILSDDSHSYGQGGSVKEFMQKLESLEMSEERITVTHSVTFPCGFTFPKEIYENDPGEIKREEYRWKIYEKIKEKFGFHDNDTETEYFKGNVPSESSFNIHFAVSVPDNIKTDAEKVDAWIKDVEKFVKEECGCSFINWQGGERLETVYGSRKQYRMEEERIKDFAHPNTEDLHLAKTEEIIDYCKISEGIDLAEYQAVEVYNFYHKNSPYELAASSAGNLYIHDFYNGKTVPADAELLVAGHNLRSASDHGAAKTLDYLMEAFDGIGADNGLRFKDLLSQISADKKKRLNLLSEVLADSFETLDRHDEFWKALLDYGANPAGAVRIAAEDANLGDNLNWLLDNIPESRVKEIFSDKSYAEEVYDIAKKSVTHDIGSWASESDIGFAGFKRIAVLCGQEKDADRFYGECLEKCLGKSVEPNICQLLDTPELLAEKMNNSKVHPNEPSISRDQASSILDYCNYENIKFYVAKDGGIYSLDVSEDYNGEGMAESNFGIVANGIEYARKAHDLEYPCYSTESFSIVEELWQKERQFANPSVENTIKTFTDDIDKMRDFDGLPKEDFLASYDYISEKEYDATANELKEHGRTGLQTVKALAYKNVMDKNYLAYDNRLEKSGSEADKIQSAIERLTDVSLPVVAGEIGKSEQEVAEIISALLDAKDYVEERFNVVRPTADEIIEKVRDEVSWADIFKTELSWKELGLNPEDYDRTESGTETEKDFKEWAMGLELENTLDLHGFDTALEGVSSWNNSTISEQKWMIIDKLSEEIVSGKLKIENSQDAFDKLLKENEVYKDFVQKGIVKDDVFGLREITEKELKSVSTKEPVDIIKEIATQKELAEVPELFTREFKYRMKTRFPGPEKDPFIVAKAIINDWKTSKPDYIPALNKWLSDSLKKEGFSTKEDLEKGFEKFFKKLSSPEQKHMQHKDSDIGQGR